jgi:hypothetical protein
MKKRKWPYRSEKKKNSFTNCRNSWTLNELRPEIGRFRIKHTKYFSPYIDKNINHESFL